MSAGTLSDKLKGALRSFPADKAAGEEMDTLLSLHKGRFADVNFTIGDEDMSDVREINVQFNDEDGNPVGVRCGAIMALFADANPNAFATSTGSTGIAIKSSSPDGALLALVASKVWLVVTESDGDLDLEWTDTGTDAAYLGVLLPNGTWAMSAVIQNAA